MGSKLGWGVRGRSSDCAAGTGRNKTLCVEKLLEEIGSSIQTGQAIVPKLNAVFIVILVYTVKYG